MKSIECLGVLSTDDKDNFLNSLMGKKGLGDLTYPSKDIVDICKICEHFLRVHETNLLAKENFITFLKSQIVFNGIKNNYLLLCIVNTLKEHVLKCNSNRIHVLIESIILKDLSNRSCSKLPDKSNYI